jgi:phosphatidylcholine synthase
MTVAQGKAWLVHLYTACGGVIGVFGFIAAAEGRIRDAFLLLVLTTIIDATDGLLARRWQVGRVLPQFDGAMVDNVIDILNFAWTPILIMAQTQVLPSNAWLVIPALASLYAYGQTNMKTDDGYFIGFPTYWNIVALYLFWLQPPPLVAVLLITIPGILSFVPTRYLYPSKGSTLWRTSWALGAIWGVLLVFLLSQETPDMRLIGISLLYPAYYMLASFGVDYRVRRGLRV